jgi:putative mycofactocin binding protein MftB
VRRVLTEPAARHVLIDRALELHPQVALRPEAFGALAYHYGNRRLLFLKHRDLVAVVETLADQPDLRAAFEACDIEPHRRPAFEAAIASMIESDIVRDRVAAA